jgi:DNA-binding response OmpR family regulator
MKAELMSALIVDDDEVVRKMLTFALERVGFCCLSSQDGSDASATLEGGTFDLVITDIIMPKTNGHVLASQLLEGPERPIIVVHTSVLEPKIAKDLTLRGVDEIVYKPTDYRAFADRMKNLVDAKRTFQREYPIELSTLKIERLNHPDPLPEQRPNLVT